MPDRLLSDQVNSQEITIILRELSSLLERGVPGDVTEFGCYIGTTSVFLAKKLHGTNRKLWLYDSFEGLPEKTAEDASAAGDHFKKGELHTSRRQLEHNLRSYSHSSYSIRKAWFSDLTTNDIPHQIALAFLDGDYYKSILDPLQLIWECMSPGGLVIVDDYNNPALPGATRAVDEWARLQSLKVRHEHGLALLEKPSTQR